MRKTLANLVLSVAIALSSLTGCSTNNRTNITIDNVNYPLTQKEVKNYAQKYREISNNNLPDNQAAEKYLQKVYGQYQANANIQAMNSGN